MNQPPALPTNPESSDDQVIQTHSNDPPVTTPRDSTTQKFPYRTTATSSRRFQTDSNPTKV
ncbi:unnamed protein product, partial [Rotaria socialis]